MFICRATKGRVPNILEAQPFIALQSVLAPIVERSLLYLFSIYNVSLVILPLLFGASLDPFFIENDGHRLPGLQEDRDTDGAIY